MIIVLIGFMGSGKSFIGNELSQKLGIPRYDLDYEISKKYQLSVSDIFSQKGENFFRKIESKTLFSFSKKDNCIISSGGGILEYSQNKKLLSKNCFIKIFLNPKWEIIYERISKSKRPLVLSLEKNELWNLYNKRLVDYEKMADLTITSDNSTDIIKEILTYLKSIKA